MKFKLMAGAATAAFISASAAHAADGWYAAFDLGIDDPGPWKTRNLNLGCVTGCIGITENNKNVLVIVGRDNNVRGGLIDCNDQTGFSGTGTTGAGTATGSRPASDTINGPAVSALQAQYNCTVVQPSTVTQTKPDGTLVPASNREVYKFNYDEDWVGFARLGYRAAPHWRVELEFGHRYNELRSVIGSPNNPYNVEVRSPRFVATVATVATTQAAAVASAQAVCPGIAPTASAVSSTNPIFCGSDIAEGAIYDHRSWDNVQGDWSQYSLVGNFLYDFAPNSKIDPFVGAGFGLSWLSVEAQGSYHASVVIPPEAFLQPNPCNNVTLTAATCPSPRVD